MNPWDADINLSLEDARAIVLAEFPAFVDQSFRLFSSGWDNDAYLAGDRVVFRFPRRKVAARLIENELRILPLLADHLTISISRSTDIGHPTEDYPYVWAGYPLLPGETACRVEWTDEERSANARTLAQFLKALHSFPVEDAIMCLPGDELQRTDMEMRLPKLLERSENVRPVLPNVDIRKIQTIAETLSRFAINDLRSEIHVCHGDLYARHIIVSKDKAVTGIIDWGDVHLGDRAVDLSVAFTFLPYSAHDEFRKTYGEIDQETWDRAKFRAIYAALAIAEYGADIKDESLIKAAEFCLLSIQSNNLT